MVSPWSSVTRCCVSGSWRGIGSGRQIAIPQKFFNFSFGSLEMNRFFGFGMMLLSSSMGFTVAHQDPDLEWRGGYHEGLGGVIEGDQAKV